MKILGLKSKLFIAGHEWTVTKITKKEIIVNGAYKMELGLDEVAREITKGTWKVISL